MTFRAREASFWKNQSQRIEIKHFRHGGVRGSDAFTVEAQQDHEDHQDDPGGAVAAEGEGPAAVRSRRGLRMAAGNIPRARRVASRPGQGADHIAAGLGGDHREQREGLLAPEQVQAVGGKG